MIEDSGPCIAAAQDGPASPAAEDALGNEPSVATRAAALALLLSGGLLTYNLPDTSAILALPAGIAAAGLTLVIVPRRRTGGTSLGEIVFTLILSLFASLVWLVVATSIPAITPRVELTLTGYEEIDQLIAQDPARSALLEEARLDGRIDMRESRVFKRRVDHEVVDRVLHP